MVSRGSSINWIASSSSISGSISESQYGRPNFPGEDGFPSTSDNDSLWMMLSTFALALPSYLLPFSAISLSFKTL